MAGQAQAESGSAGGLVRRIVPFVVFAVIALIPPPEGLDRSQWTYFAIFAGAIAGLVFESAAPGAVGFVAMTTAAVLGLVEKETGKSLQWALHGFGDSTVWLIFGAFVFSTGYKKSGLGRRIALTLVRALGRKTLGLGYAAALTDLALAPGTPSNTARCGGTIFPIISNIPAVYGSAPGPTARKLGGYIMWNSFAVTGVTSSMFLTALAPNAAALAIAKKTVGVDVTWGQWAIGFLPVGIILFALAPLLAYLLYPPEIKESPEISDWASSELKAMGPLARNEWLMLGFVVLAMLLWIFGSNPNFSVPFLGSNFINATMVVLLIIALMLLTGVVELADIVENKAAWEVLLYFTTLLTLADGLNKIGFVKWFASLAAAPLAGQDPTLALIGLVAIFFWVHYFFSSITSHAAAIFPIVLAIGQSIPGMHMLELVMLCAFSLGLMGVISPYATGPAPMFYGAGYISRGAFWALGLVFGLVYFAALLGIGLPWLRMIGY